MNESMVRNFLADEAGATAIEYGVLIAMLAIAIIAAVTLVGSGLDAMFRNQTLNDTLANAPA